MFPIYIEPLNLTFPTSKDSFQCPFFVSNLLFMFSIYFSCYQSTFCVSNLITMFPMFFSCFQSTYYRKSLLCISPSKLKIIPVKIIYDGLGCLMDFNNMCARQSTVYSFVHTVIPRYHHRKRFIDKHWYSANSLDFDRF